MAWWTKSTKGSWGKSWWRKTEGRYARREQDRKLIREGLVEVQGVEWCHAHQGIIDECASGEDCDMTDGTECEVVRLYAPSERNKE